MKFKLLLFFCLCLVTSRLYAQTGFYEAGYVVQSGDTIQGLIERTDELALSRSVNFKKDPAAASPDVYFPNTIEGFGFDKDNLYYASVEAEVRRGNDVQQVSRFAKALLSGYINLYKLPLMPEELSIILEEDNSFVYVIRKEGKDYTLGQYEYRKDNRVVMNKRYIGVMKAVLTDCPDSAITFDNLRFEDRAMIKAIGAYNVCLRPDIPTSHYAYEVKAIIKHGPEVSYGKIFSERGKLISSSHVVSMGYFFDILKPDISQRHSTRVGIHYLVSQSKSLISNLEVSQTVHYIRLPLLAQFNFAKSPDAPFSPFLNVGMAGQLITNQSYVDIETFFSVGGGFYTDKLRFSVLLDNEQLKFRSAKVLHFAVGFRLDSWEKR